MYSGQSFSFLDFIEDKDAFLASDWQLESKRFNKMYMVLFAFPVIRRYIYRNIVDTVDLNKYAGILDTAVDSLRNIPYNIQGDYDRYIYIWRPIFLRDKTLCIDNYFDSCQTFMNFMVVFNDNFFYIIFFIKNNIFGVYDLYSDDICTFHISMLNDIISAAKVEAGVFGLAGPGRFC